MHTSIHTVLYDPDGLLEAGLPLDREPYESLVKAVLAWTGEDALTTRDYEQIALQLTGHVRALAADVQRRADQLPKNSGPRPHQRVAPATDLTCRRSWRAPCAAFRTAPVSSARSTNAWTAWKPRPPPRSPELLCIAARVADENGEAGSYERHRARETVPVTTTAATASAVPQPARDRGLGRGVSTLIPQGAALSPTGQAAAALAALRTVPVHAGLLQAAALLLEESARTSNDDDVRVTITQTAALLREALDLATE